MEDRAPSPLTKFLRWCGRDGPVWIVVCSMLFLLVVNLHAIRFLWGGK